MENEVCNNLLVCMLYIRKTKILLQKIACPFTKITPLDKFPHKCTIIQYESPAIPYIPCAHETSVFLFTLDY